MDKEEVQEKTKECPKCKSQINAKATKCPQCQSDLRSWFRRHPIWTVVLVLLAVGLIAAVGGGSGTQNSGETSENTEVSADQEKEAVEYNKIKASELADDFDANQVAAENEWNNKLVEFSAEISNITDSGISFYNVASKEFSLTQISCLISNKDQLLSLKNGETVTVRGEVGKQSMGVIVVNNCEVVE